MSIKVAKHSGFCFGVNRSIKIVNNLLDSGKTVCTLGPIIHNPQIVDNLKKRGVSIASSPEEVPPDSTLVIRSHGVAKSVIDDVKKLGINYVDATCPFVKKIHDIVNEIPKDENAIFIAGSRSHPEVEGIIGNSVAESFVFGNTSELMDIINNNSFSGKSVFVLAQTTFDINEWNECLRILQSSFKKLKIYNTICSTTQNRQLEALELSKTADVVIVVGGKNSSNTSKLKLICENNCDTYLVETADELPTDKIKNTNFIGIVAGASTPDDIILEVKQKVEEIKNKETNSNDKDMSFEQLLEESLKNMSNGNKVKGTVVSITPNEICVDVGRKQAGFIPLSELTYDTDTNVEDLVKVGDVLDLLIMRTNDQDGTIMLSKKRFDSLTNWDDMENAQNDQTILKGKVTGIVKGGMIVNFKGAKVFIPASLSGVPKGETLDNLKNKTIEFRIVEVDKQKRRIIGSVRSVLNSIKEQQKEKFWETTKIGDEVIGKVRSFLPYGAFVDLGGIDGMIHVSELSWDRVKHPSDIVKLDEEITVEIKDMDKETGRVSLRYKGKGENPWKIFERDYHVGSVMDVTIVALTDFGAFAKILPGIDGLIHVSQISEDRINKPSDVLKIGDIVKVKIIDLDMEKHRIGLSIKALSDPTTVDEQILPQVPHIEDPVDTSTAVTSEETKPELIIEEVVLPEDKAEKPKKTTAKKTKTQPAVTNIPKETEPKEEPKKATAKKAPAAKSTEKKEKSSTKKATKPKSTTTKTTKTDK